MQPAWTSLDTPYRVKTTGGEPDASGAILDVGRGNWQPGQAQGDQLSRPKWMAVVIIDGQIVYGTIPQMPFAPGAEVILPGEKPWGERLLIDLDARGYADGRHHGLETRIYAASHWPGGWGDNASQPAGWEWGHYSARDATPAVFVQSFQLVAPPPPTPSPGAPTFAQLRDHAKGDLARALELVATTDTQRRSKAPRPYFAERILLSSPGELTRFLAGENPDDIWVAD